MKTCLMCRQKNIDYYGLCPECSAYNSMMRQQTCDLTGKTAVVTGGRIKIGYAVCLRLLRSGASVIAVTRYPKTALKNYRREPDYDEFKQRLFIIGFDLLRADMIGVLISNIETISHGKIDILVNNAAQTVKKSNEYYLALQAHERELLSEGENCLLIPLNEQDNSIMPFGVLSDYGETENENSWVRKPEAISAKELLEVELINVTAPFLLANGLRQYMQHKGGNKFVINVSSVEGRFNMKQKLARHVHTNMAKASLNMMTHSIASDFARDGIYVYSCDPGWVSNQFPPGYEISKSFEPYLTFDDGAARVLYPIVKNINEPTVKDSGSFYKDYKIIDY